MLRGLSIVNSSSSFGWYWLLFSTAEGQLEFTWVFLVAYSDIPYGLHPSTNRGSPWCRATGGNKRVAIKQTVTLTCIPHNNPSPGKLEFWLSRPTFVFHYKLNQCILLYTRTFAVTDCLLLRAAFLTCASISVKHGPPLTSISSFRSFNCGVLAIPNVVKTRFYWNGLVAVG